MAAYVSEDNKEILACGYIKMNCDKYIPSVICELCASYLEFVYQWKVDYRELKQKGRMKSIEMKVRGYRLHYIATFVRGTIAMFRNAQIKLTVVNNDYASLLDGSVLYYEATCTKSKNKHKNRMQLRANSKEVTFSTFDVSPSSRQPKHIRFEIYVDVMPPDGSKTES